MWPRLLRHCSSLRSEKRRRVSLSGSSSTSQGSIVTAISSGVTDTFDGHSNTVYKHCLQAIQPTATKVEYVSFLEVEVPSEEDGVWTTGKVCAVSFSSHSVIHDASFVRQQHLVQQKSALFDSVGGQH